MAQREEEVREVREAAAGTPDATVLGCLLFCSVHTELSGYYKIKYSAWLCAAFWWITSRL